LEFILFWLLSFFAIRVGQLSENTIQENLLLIPTGSGVKGQLPIGVLIESKISVLVLYSFNAEFPEPNQHQYSQLYKELPQQPSYLQRNGHVIRDRHGRKSY
jgi:hypothetical protein